MTAAWLNHVVLQIPRNGTATHAIDPSNVTGGGTVQAGSAFTPTAGRFLLIAVEGAVTSTTPTGFTLPTSGSSVGNTGLYVWYKASASGGDTASTTHNGSDYPIVAEVWEYATGTTFTGAAESTGNASGSSSPTLSGLTGTNTIIGLAGIGIVSTPASASFTWDTGTESANCYIDKTGGTDGYGYSSTYVDGSAATSAAYAPTVTTTGGSSGNLERLMVALAVVTGGSSTTVTLGIAAETDTADTLAARLKVRTLGQPNETDTAETLTRAKARTLGNAAETDAADTLAKRIKARAFGYAAETASAWSAMRAKLRALVQAVETDTAITLGTGQPAQLLDVAAQLTVDRWTITTDADRWTVNLTEKG